MEGLRWWDTLAGASSRSTLSGRESRVASRITSHESRVAPYRLTALPPSLLHCFMFKERAGYLVCLSIVGCHSGKPETPTPMPQQRTPDEERLHSDWAYLAR